MCVKDTLLVKEGAPLKKMKGALQFTGIAPEGEGRDVWESRVGKGEGGGVPLREVCVCPEGGEWWV